jgi:uncharacterized protein (TIGR00730 family)
VKICFIGSGIEREKTCLHGIEVQAVARAVRDHFDTLVFGGSSIGLMESFASAFANAGGHVISVVPRWLEATGLVFAGFDPVFCENLAERKRLMFEQTDAVLCYPGGLGTWDELFDLLARRAVEPHPMACPPIYLYNWEKYFAPMLLQIETALEMGLIHQETVTMLHPFETVEALAELLGAHRRGGRPPTDTQEGGSPSSWT